MIRKASAALLLLLAIPAAATDLSLLIGWQYNRDMEIGSVPAPGTSTRPGDGLALSNGAAVTVGLDFPLPGDPDARLGALLTYSETKFDDSAGLRDDGMGVTHLHFTGSRYYPYGHWEPFVMAGIGASFFDPDDRVLDSNTRLSAHIAGGTTLHLDEQLLLRLEARWLGSFFDGRGTAICSGGCTVALESEAYSQVQVNLGLQFRF
jgi:hypothetical protein